MEYDQMTVDTLFASVFQSLDPIPQKSNIQQVSRYTMSFSCLLIFQLNLVGLKRF